MRKNVFLIIQSLVIIILICLFLLNYNNFDKKEYTLPISTELISSSRNFQTKQILIIGNSISIHGICKYWWGHWGMAASSKEKDYAHILAKSLNNNQNIELNILSFYAWEVNAHDRSELIELLLPALNQKPDYIVIQLGENITDTQTLNQDFDEFINFIITHTQSASIVVIGNFWENNLIDKIKADICVKYNIKFIDLKDIQKEDFYNKIGNIVNGDDNKKHVIKHDGVAKHPNDKAMEYIANKILKVL